MKEVPLNPEINYQDRVFILSIGQLINLNFHDTIKNFSSILAEDSAFGENLGYYTNYVKTLITYGFHEASYARLVSRLPNIPYVFERKEQNPKKTNEILLYKEGKISEENFIALLRSKLNISEKVPNEKILDSWSLSSRISDENLDKIAEIIKDAEKQKYTLAIVCSIDPSSYQKFLDQINPKLEIANAKKFEKNDHILIVKSFEKNFSGKNTLARILVQEYQLDHPGIQLVSLYRHITPINIETKHAQLIYEPVDHQPFGWYSSIPRLMHQKIFGKPEYSSPNISPSSIVRGKSKEDLLQISQ